MTALRAATPDDAKAVWDSIKNAGRRPSVRGVATALNASGQFLTVPHVTVQRWKARNWTAPKQRGREPALQAAVSKLDAVVPALTGKAVDRIEAIEGKPPAPIGGGKASPSTEGKGSQASDDPPTPMQGRARALAAEFDLLSEADKIKQTTLRVARTLFVFTSLVEERPDLIVEAPQAAGAIVKALAGSMVAMVNGVKAGEEAEKRAREAAMKTIESDAAPPEEDPMQSVWNEYGRKAQDA